MIPKTFKSLNKKSFFPKLKSNIIFPTLNCINFEIKLSEKSRYYTTETAPREGNDGKPFFSNAEFSRDSEGKRIYPEKIQKIVSDIMQLNMAETILITDLLQEKLGITNEQLMPSPMMYGNAGNFAQQQQQQTQAPTEETKVEEAPKEPEAPKRTSFNIKLTNITEGNKIKVLKVIRNLKKGMALMESKTLIDNLPSIIGENIPPEEADEKWKKALEEVGATVELF